MIRQGRIVLFAIAASATATGLYAQATPVTCSVPDLLPPELAAWSRPHSALAAVGKTSHRRKALVTRDRATDVRLLPTPKVRFTVQPGKPGGSVSKGGMIAFDAPVAGTYRVALGSAAWIDVVEDGQSVASTTHGHGPDCSGIRKMVDYQLKAGPHVLQLSASADDSITVLVTKLP